MLESLNTIDYVVFALVLAGAVIGAFRGFIEIVSKYAGYLVGLVVAVMFTKMLGAFVSEKTGLNTFFSSFVSYVSIYLLTFIIIKSLGSAFSQMTESTAFETVDQILGFVLGICIALIIEALFTELLSKQHIVDLSNPLSLSWTNQNILLPIRNVIFKFAKEVI